MKRKAFTLIEFLVVLAIISLISVFIIVSLKSMREKSRDTRRFQEMNQIAKALQLYWIDHEQYPEETCPCTDGGHQERNKWETSDEEPGEFLEYLAPYLSETSLDPINQRAGGFKSFGPRSGSFFYAYQRYEPPLAYCPEIDRPFMIIAIRDLEAYTSPDLPEKGMPLPLEIKIPRATCGDPGPDGICTVNEYVSNECRDWSQEFDYSVMLME